VVSRLTLLVGFIALFILLTGSSPSPIAFAAFAVAVLIGSAVVDHRTEVRRLDELTMKAARIAGVVSDVVRAAEERLDERIAQHVIALERRLANSQNTMDTIERTLLPSIERAQHSLITSLDRAERSLNTSIDKADRSLETSISSAQRSIESLIASAKRSIEQSVEKAERSIGESIDGTERSIEESIDRAQQSIEESIANND